MRRWLSVASTLVAITLLEFHFFPGHSYLRSSSQIFVAMIERLAAPAFLSRDFVATPPHLVFTAFDEITLLLHRVSHQDFQSVVAWQQLAFGSAVLYQPSTAALLWAAIALTFILNRQLRPLLRPMLTILFVFVLLLANLAQLQPGVVDTGAFFRQISFPWMRILRERTPEVMISTWSGRAIMFYLLVFVGGVM